MLLLLLFLPLSISPFPPVAMNGSSLTYNSITYSASFGIPDGNPPGWTGHAAWMMFNKVACDYSGCKICTKTTLADAVGNAYSTAWVQLYMSTPQFVSKIGYFNINWYRHVIEASTDGINFTPLITLDSNCRNCNSWDYENIPVPQAFNYFRMRALYLPNNAQFCASEIVLFEATCDANARVVNGSCQCNDGYSGSGYVCTWCAVGTYGVNGQCYPCASGAFSTKIGSTDCSLCASGSYNSQSGQSTCPLCNAGECEIVFCTPHFVMVFFQALSAARRAPVSVAFVRQVSEKISLILQNILLKKLYRIT